MTSVSGNDMPALPTPVLTDTSARIVPRDEHPISRSQISENALKVLYRLINAGHQAFLVGGGIRDLLIGITPKDFDVATDADPEEVRALFRNARLIGRRFRLAHVRFGRDVIEVATFRGSAGGDDTPRIEREALPSRRRALSEDEPAAALSGAGMILRDNVYGDIEDDAARRDFTINALYYTPADFCIYDFAGGIEDIAARRIRLIGDPELRYREDPVRMLRALRFAAKLDFEIDPATAKPISELADLLLDVPPARLFDEVVKLLLFGRGEATLDLLLRYGIFPVLFPDAAAAMDRDPSQEDLLRTALANSDRRVEQDRPVTPGFLYASLLWPAVVPLQQALEAEGTRPLEALGLAGAEVIARQQSRVTIPRRFTTFMRETWELQPRLEHPTSRQVQRLLAHPRFRAAYDFLVVRERAGHATGGMGDWWTRFQDADDTTRQEMRAALGGSGTNRKRRRKRRRKPAS